MLDTLIRYVYIITDYKADIKAQAKYYEGIL